MTKKIQLDEKKQQLLREQTITELTPGTLLHDFETFLTFIADHPLTATGKHHLLPLSSLEALNARMSRPLALAMKRPVQKSYPHLNGLFLLARATGLLRVKGQDGESRLLLDDAALASWRALNPTERYFTLLEAYLLHASQEMIGEPGRWLDMPGQQMQLSLVWNRIGEKGIKVPPGKSQDGYIVSSWLHHFALLELFGLISVKPGKPAPAKPLAAKGWSISEIHRTPFGQALIGVVSIGTAEFMNRLFDGEEEEDLRPPKNFNTYQEQFQPYFPEWQRCFTLEDEAVYRPGIFQFKVSLGKAWRRIAIPSEAMLEDLSIAILDSVDFDNDHLHSFEYRNRFGVTERIYHEEMDEGPFSNEVRVGDLPLSPGDEMKYTFDFGDDWRFQILLEAVAPLDKKVKRARLLESHGKAPKQYRDWDQE